MLKHFPYFHIPASTALHNSFSDSSIREGISKKHYPAYSQSFLSHGLPSPQPVSYIPKSEQSGSLRVELVDPRVLLHVADEVEIELLEEAVAELVNNPMDERVLWMWAW